MFMPKLKHLAITALSLALITTYASAKSIEGAPLPSAGWQDDNWTDPGGWTTIDVTRYGLNADEEQVDSALVVRKILDATAAEGYRILQFPEGKFWFKSDLTITADGVRIIGAGMTKTQFIQDDAQLSFQSPDLDDLRIPLDQPPARGDTSLISSGADQLEVGDYILPAAQFPYRGNVDWYLEKMSKLGFGQIVIVTAIEGDTVHFNMPLGLDYADQPDQRIRVLKMQKDVGIEQVHFEKLQNDHKSTLHFYHVTNGYAKNIRFYYTSKEHVAVDDGYRIFIEGCNFSHSHDYGEGGHGYGIQFVTNTTRSYIVNNKFFKLRHAVVIQEGSNHNVIAYNNNNASNILLHGNYAHNNLFEGNAAQGGINYDKVHGTNGPFNTIFRNNASIGQRGLMPRLSSDIMEITVGNVTSGYKPNQTSFNGANKVGEEIIWGEIEPNTLLPDSLYLNEQPDFLSGRPWPLFGPGTGDDWGASRTNPAADRDIEAPTE